MFRSGCRLIGPDCSVRKAEGRVTSWLLTNSSPVSQIAGREDAYLTARRTKLARASEAPGVRLRRRLLRQPCFSLIGYCGVMSYRDATAGKRLRAEQIFALSNVHERCSLYKSMHSTLPNITK